MPWLSKMFCGSKKKHLSDYYRMGLNVVMTSVTWNHHIVHWSSGQAGVPSAGAFLSCWNASAHLIVLLYYILEQMKSASHYCSIYK